MEKEHFGLLPLPRDDRDRMLGAAYALPKLKELPLEFKHTPPFGIKDQGQTDFCTGFSTCAASELQEGVRLVPEYQFAISKEIQGGDVDTFGVDLRSAMMSHKKVGAIEESSRPQGYKVGERDASFLRRIGNWPDLKLQALVRAKSQFLAVTGPYDAFDNIRASIWLFREEKRVPVFGVLWGWGQDRAVVDNASIQMGEGHAIYATGWEVRNGEPHLVIPNSWGEGAGDHGYFYLSRSVINRFVGMYGAFMFVDMTKEEYEARLRPTIFEQILIIMAKILRIQLEIARLAPHTPIPPEVKISRIKDWAEAIEIFENAPKKWNNPGAIRGVDGKFLNFPSYDAGFDYLCEYLVRACTGKHAAYPKGGESTLLEFQRIYSPTSDGNSPERYASFIAHRLGVPISIQIKELA